MLLLCQSWFLLSQIFFLTALTCNCYWQWRWIKEGTWKKRLFTRWFMGSYSCYWGEAFFWLCYTSSKWLNLSSICNFITWSLIYLSSLLNYIKFIVIGWARWGNSSLLLNQHGDAIIDHWKQAIRSLQFVRIN